ncbi:MAG: HU family DNA-binding protein [Bacteroidaceae bacterium]|nr:HU family DNA-binding protein [Bacteroidaceae bacterium]
MGKVYIKVQQQYFRPEDKQMYFTKSITYTKIGYDELVEHIAKDSGMSEAAVEGAVRSILKQVEEMVLNGHTICIKEFGTLKVSFNAKAPLDREEAGAKQVYRRRLLYFPSERIKEEVENTTLVCETKLT